MIKNVVVHMSGRQPMLADLPAVPGTTDQSLIATNVRTRDGKRPSFAEDVESWFLIPLHEVVVIELPAHAFAQHPSSTPEHQAASPRGAEPDHGSPGEIDDQAPDTSPLEPDEDLLARIRQL